MRGPAVATVVAWVMAFGSVHAAEHVDAPAPPHLGACGAGSGGFLLPGTEACLTIGGFVRADGTWTVASPRLALAPQGGTMARGSMPDAGLDRSTFGTGARLTADVRVPTELGPVRVFVSLRGHNGVATDRASR